MANKKYPAQKIEIFAIYRVFKIFGGPGRSFEAAFPDLKDAEEWVENEVKKGSFLKKEDFMIEEMNATMKAWQP